MKLIWNAFGCFLWSSIFIGVEVHANFSGGLPAPNPEPVGTECPSIAPSVSSYTWKFTPNDGGTIQSGTQIIDSNGIKHWFYNFWHGKFEITFGSINLADYITMGPVPSTKLPMALIAPPTPTSFDLENGSLFTSYDFGFQVMNPNATDNCPQKRTSYTLTFVPPSSSGSPAISSTAVAESGVESQSSIHIQSSSTQTADVATSSIQTADVVSSSTAVSNGASTAASGTCVVPTFLFFSWSAYRSGTPHPRADPIPLQPDHPFDLNNDNVINSFTFHRDDELGWADLSFDTEVRNENFFVKLGDQPVEGIASKTFELEPQQFTSDATQTWLLDLLDAQQNMCGRKIEIKFIWNGQTSTTDSSTGIETSTGIATSTGSANNSTCILPTTVDVFWWADKNDAIYPLLPTHPFKLYENELTVTRPVGKGTINIVFDQTLVRNANESEIPEKNKVFNYDVDGQQVLDLVFTTLNGNGEICSFAYDIRILPVQTVTSSTGLDMIQSSVGVAASTSIPTSGSIESSTGSIIPLTGSSNEGLSSAIPFQGSTGTSSVSQSSGTNSFVCQVPETADIKFYDSDGNAQKLVVTNSYWHPQPGFTTYSYLRTAKIPGFIVINYDKYAVSRVRFRSPGLIRTLEPPSQNWNISIDAPYEGDVTSPFQYFFTALDTNNTECGVMWSIQIGYNQTLCDNCSEPIGTGSTGMATSNFRYLTGEFSECNCDGLQYRVVMCTDKPSIDSPGAYDDDLWCLSSMGNLNAGSKPVSIQQCQRPSKCNQISGQQQNGQPQPMPDTTNFRYLVSEWSPCGCNGVQSRVVMCTDKPSITSTGAYDDNLWCLPSMGNYHAGDRPSTIQTCQIPSTCASQIVQQPIPTNNYTWQTGPFGQCNCDGKQYRSVVCSNSDYTTTYDSSFCRIEFGSVDGNPPLSEQNCQRPNYCQSQTVKQQQGHQQGGQQPQQMDTTNFKYLTGEWSQCDCNGVQSRVVMCTDKPSITSTGAYDDNLWCLPSMGNYHAGERPAAQQPCTGPSTCSAPQTGGQQQFQSQPHSQPSPQSMTSMTFCEKYSLQMFGSFNSTCYQEALISYILVQAKTAGNYSKVDLPLSIFSDNSSYNSTAISVLGEYLGCHSLNFAQRDSHVPFKNFIYAFGGEFGLFAESFFVAFRSVGGSSQESHDAVTELFNLAGVPLNFNINQDTNTNNSNSNANTNVSINNNQSNKIVIGSRKILSLFRRRRN